MAFTDAQRQSLRKLIDDATATPRTDLATTYTAYKNVYVQGSAMIGGLVETLGDASDTPKYRADLELARDFILASHRFTRLDCNTHQNNFKNIPLLNHFARDFISDELIRERIILACNSEYSTKAYIDDEQAMEEWLDGLSKPKTLTFGDFFKQNAKINAHNVGVTTIGGIIGCGLSALVIMAYNCIDGAPAPYDRGLPEAWDEAQKAMAQNWIYLMAVALALIAAFLIVTAVQANADNKQAKKQEAKGAPQAPAPAQAPSL